MYLNMNSELNKKQIFIKNLIYNLDVFNYEIREKSMFILDFNPMNRYTKFMRISCVSITTRFSEIIFLN